MVFNKSGLCFIFVLAALKVMHAQTGTEQVVLNFSVFPSGAYPYGTLTRDSLGNLYGTTYSGGNAEQGVVFEYTAAGKYSVLYNFQGGTADGGGPVAGIALDSAGNIFGTTQNGGSAGMGVVYEINTLGQETILHSFLGGADGNFPYSGVVIDPQGNLYGTTYYGGPSNAGVVYKIPADGQELVLYAFTGGNDGGNPYAGVTLGANGNLYGTTQYGGFNRAGVVYEISPTGQETILYTFSNESGCGGVPEGGLIFDTAGNLYGSASSVVFELSPGGQCTPLATQKQYGVFGGYMSPGTVARDSAGNLYWTTEPVQQSTKTNVPNGAVLKASPGGKITVLYAFPGSSNPLQGLASYGPQTNAGVVLDSDGNVYGTTGFGGVSGSFYEVATSGKVTTLHNFSGAVGGTEPASLLVASNGEVYGTTQAGGTDNWGTVYKVNASGKETTLYSFKGGSDGGSPSSAIAVDSLGNVYGTTAVGGGTANAGTVFKVSASGQETILHSFTSGPDGGFPDGGVVLSSSGTLYGTTFGGGSGSLTGLQEGVVFAISPAGVETVIYNFTGLSDGGQPRGQVILDSEGNLYGTTWAGGAFNDGTVFKVTSTGKETVLYSFTGGADGANPEYGFVRSSKGSLYGTNENGGGPQGGGILFELAASGKLTILHEFSGATAGSRPYGLVMDTKGNLYGSTLAGGSGCSSSGCGLLYLVNTQGAYSTIYTFTGGADGTGGALAISPAGKVYGAGNLGVDGGGSLYKLEF